MSSKQEYLCAWNLRHSILVAQLCWAYAVNSAEQRGNAREETQGWGGRDGAVPGIAVFLQGCDSSVQALTWTCMLLVLIGGSRPACG